MNGLEKWVGEATKGDKVALEKLITEIQDMVYNLAIRMLWHPDDAQDASQEILIKVVTHLARFEERSSFKTWVYRLASNTLINFKKQRQARQLTFEGYAQELKEGLSDPIAYGSSQTEQQLLVAEAKIGCSHAMLQCLNESDRMVYIIGEILEFNGKEGAYILDISHENFRKKLSRTRNKLHAFLRENCGIVNKANACRCHKKVNHGVARGYINPQKLLFANKKAAEKLIQDIENLQKEVHLYQSNPNYKAPEEWLIEVRRIVSLSN